MFISLCLCVQDRSGSIIVMKYKITQACFSLFGLLQASRKFSRTDGTAGRETVTLVPSFPPSMNPRPSCLQIRCMALFRQGSLDPPQTSCQLMFCSLMQIMLELLKCSSVSSQNRNKFPVTSHPKVNNCAWGTHHAPLASFCSSADDLVNIYFSQLGVSALSSSLIGVIRFRT